MKVQPTFASRRGPLLVNTKHILVKDGKMGRLEMFGQNEADLAAKISLAAKNEKKEKSEPSWILQRVRKFCSDSSLHAIKYVADLDRYVLERVFWALMFTLSLCASVPPMTQAWQKFNDNTLSVVLQQTAEPVWKIPFPEVVICNEAVVRGTVLEEQKFSEEFSLLCNSLSAPNESTFINKDDFHSFVKKIHVPANEFIETLSFGDRSTNLNYEKDLTPRFSGFGLCFSFNALPFNEIFTKENYMSFEDNAETDKSWDLERGYFKSWYKQVPIPRRAINSGNANAFRLLLKRERKTIVSPCSPPNTGFKVGVKNPADGVYSLDDFIRISMGKQTNFRLTPKLVLTENATRSMSPEERNCFFQDERKLRFFQYYTQKNCLAECASNISVEMCNCVDYHMPRTKDTNICLGIPNKKCSSEVAVKLEKDLVVGIVGGVADANKRQCTNCNCLPACTHLSYTFDVFNGDLMSTNDDVAYLEFYFKENEFFPLIRVKYYDFLAFMSTCGGLLGLFLGFSLLSFVELIYFLCVLPVVKFFRECFNEFETQIDN